MNRIKSILKFLSFCLLLTIPSCYFEMTKDNSNDPEAGNHTPPVLNASFIPSAKSGNVPMTVHFTNNSYGNIEGYEWDFNNDGIIDSTEKNPSHTFRVSAKYDVRLKVTSIGHYTDETIEAITVSFGMPERQTVSAGTEGPYVIYPADIDNDGDIDIICGYERSYYRQYNKLSWWENAGDGSNWIEHVIAQDDGSMTFCTISIYAADINNDGSVDIVAAQYILNTIEWWENEGNGASWTRRSVASDFIHACSVHADDIDGDGVIDIAGAANGLYNDLAGTCENSKICWWKNDSGDGTAWTEYTVKSGLDRAADVKIANIDGDAYKDIIAGIYGHPDYSLGEFVHSQILWFDNEDGSGSVWNENIIMPDSGPDYVRAPKALQAADLDGDGDKDVAAAYLQDDKIVIWINSGGGAGWTKRPIDEDFFGAQSLFVADIDGDNDLDLAGASRSGDEIAWWENIGGRWEAWEEHAVDKEFSQAVSVFAADINGDNLMDIAGAANGSYTTNTGSSLAWWSVFDVNQE